MRSSRRRAVPHEDEKLDRWLISYADFITLLFAFFVVLYAISSINEGKYRQVTDSLTEAFDVVPKSLEPIQVGEINREINDNVIETPFNRSASGENPVDSQNLKEMSKAIEHEMLSMLPSEEVIIRRSKQWLEIEFDSQVLFPSGSSTLIPEANILLGKISKILSNYPNPINVEGFTDNVPIGTERFPSNWELSASRAATVVHLLSNGGVEPGRMAAIAYGEYRPVASNQTPEGRHMNRRVVLAVLASDLNVQQKRQQENNPLANNGGK